MIIQAILIHLVMIIEKLYALNIGKIGFRCHIWEFYLVTNFRKKSEFPLVDIGGPKFRFFLLRRVYLISRIKDLCGLARVSDYWLSNVRLSWIHKVKWPKNVLIWWKWKNSYFLHKSGLQWPVMNKWKRLIYFQTKSDFLDTFLLLGSLCLCREI